ncbi:MAG: hypothetical protein WCQ90_10170 [Deltaproteobacteria bacterium]
MKKKIYTQGITLFISPKMGEFLKEASDVQETSVSEIIRTIIYAHMDAVQNSQQQKGGLVQSELPKEQNTRRPL